MSQSSSETGWKCSQFPSLEPLPGSARKGGLTVAFEYPHHWGRDILDGTAFGEELSMALKKHFNMYKADINLIRKPGRSDAHEGHHVFIASPAPCGDTTAPVLEHMKLDSPEQLLKIDLSQAGNIPGAQRLEHSIVLICTHGKRDQCCALFGRPVAKDLDESFARDNHVWESSHTGGHRFAPSMIMLPSNYSFGGLDSDQMHKALLDADAGRLPLDGNRGRGIWDTQGEIAELAVATLLQEQGEVVGLAQLMVTREPDDTDSSRTVTKNPQGLDSSIHKKTQPQQWRVQLGRSDFGTVMASCGKGSKKSSGWVVESITEL